jgi:hypothetical protein
MKRRPDLMRAPQPRDAAAITKFESRRHDRQW